MAQTEDRVEEIRGREGLVRGQREQDEGVRRRKKKRWRTKRKRESDGERERLAGATGKGGLLS